jgi:hypothetical protein
MRERERCRTRLIAVVALSGLLLVAAALSGCKAATEKDLTGTWRTQLTGYNQVAAAMTQYDQRLTFNGDGTVVMDNTLPGDVNHVTGKYVLESENGKPVVKITWDQPVDKPSLFYYSFQGGKLLLARAPGSLDVSQELNIGNQEPVVYLKVEGGPSQ